MRVIGEGPAVLFVHGNVGPGPTWKAQEALRARWRLVILARRGFRPSPPTASPDPDVDARDIGKLLAREPAHCVGFAEGGVGLAMAAGHAPERVRSLVLIDPPELLWGASGLDAIAGARVPVLVLTGDAGGEADRRADEVAGRLGAARERVSGPGGAPMRAPGFNAALERFLFAAERN